MYNVASFLDLRMLSKALNRRLFLPECWSLSLVVSLSAWRGNEIVLLVRGSETYWKYNPIYFLNLKSIWLLKKTELKLASAYPLFDSRRRVHSAWSLNKRATTGKWKPMRWDRSFLWFYGRKIALKTLYSQQKLSNILNGRNILYKPCLDEILVNWNAPREGCAECDAEGSSLHQK